MSATAQQTNTAANLHYLVRPPKVAGQTSKGVILLHGVGSNEQDLFSLADQLPDDCYVISLQGPISLGGDRHAWYEVDFSSGRPVFNKEQESASRAQLYTAIAELTDRYHLRDVYVGGFSQGAIMSYSIGLLRPDLVKGVIGMSGRILTEIRPDVKTTESLKKLRVLIVHGTQDQTLPIAYGREANAYLGTLGVGLQYREFSMGHQITPAVIEAVNTFMKQ